ncbi:MAG: hypothetical protein CMJ85_06355 [Planctomycetes bacterium]|nr:hypothetical protein [Planctomycetota bacterium]
MLQDATDVRAAGVREALFGETARPCLVDHRAEHEQADRARAVGLSQGGCQRWQGGVHRAADVEVDMGRRLRPSQLLRVPGPPAPEQWRRAVQTSPGVRPPIAGLRPHRADPDGRLDARAPVVRPGRSAGHASPSQQPSQRIAQGGAGGPDRLQAPVLLAASRGPPAQRLVRRRPVLHDASQHAARGLVPGGLLVERAGAVGATMIAEQHGVAGYLFGAGGLPDRLPGAGSLRGARFELLHEQLEQFVIGHLLPLSIVEQGVHLAFAAAGVARHGLGRSRPPRRGAQQTAREGVPAVGSLEEPCLGRELLAEHRVDDRVESQVVRHRDAGEQPRVPQDDVLQLVHDEHQQVSVALAVLLDELWVEQHARRERALHGCGRHGIAEYDVDQPQQLLHLETGGRNHVEQARAQASGVSTHGADLRPRRPARDGLFGDFVRARRAARSAALAATSFSNSGQCLGGTGPTHERRASRGSSKMSRRTASSVRLPLGVRCPR